MKDQNLELYYTPPTEHAFEDLKNQAIGLWNTFDDEFGYATEKINRIKDLENIQDNFMAMLAMFDPGRQLRLLNLVAPATKEALKKRL